MATTQSDSTVQRQAEAEILRVLAEREELPELRPGRVDLDGGTWVHVDGVSVDKTVLVEAYARQGALKGAQLKKVAQDILKLSLIKTQHPKGVRLIVAFGSEVARDSIRGWLWQAAQQHGIELVAVQLSSEWVERIERAQRRQVMVNMPAGDLADDVEGPKDADPGPGGSSA